MTRHSFLLLMGLTALAAPALAQQDVPVAKPVSCEIIEDAIIPLKPPNFTGVVEWRKVIGLEGVDRVADMMALADGGVLALGESQPYTRTGGLQAPQLYVIRLDVTGKPLFDKRMTIKNFKSVSGGIVLKDKIIVLTQIEDEKKKQSAQIHFLDGAGAIKASYTIDDPTRSIMAGDVVANADGTTLTVAAMTVDAKDAEKTYTVLYRMGLDGKILARREYLPGVSTRIEDLQRLGNGQLIGAGRIRYEGHRDAGWLLLVNRFGDLVLQRPYARGGQAQFKKIIDDQMGGYYALGESIPSDGGYRATGIMHLNPSGNLIWQRFLSGKYKYSAADLVLQKDGRLMVLMAGRPAQDGGREHARIITMSSIGDILHDEAYLEGSNALPVRLMEHTVTKQRILAGYAQTGFDDYGVPANQKLITYDTWFAGLTKLPVYTDPCKPAVRESLDDDQ